MDSPYREERDKLYSLIKEGVQVFGYLPDGSTHTLIDFLRLTGDARIVLWYTFVGDIDTTIPGTHNIPYVLFVFAQLEDYCAPLFFAPTTLLNYNHLRRILPQWDTHGRIRCEWIRQTTIPQKRWVEVATHFAMYGY
jgi:hypothetical protein